MLVCKEMCDKKGGTDGCERTRLRTVLLLNGGLLVSPLACTASSEKLHVSRREFEQARRACTTPHAAAQTRATDTVT